MIGFIFQKTEVRDVIYDTVCVLSKNIYLIMMLLLVFALFNYYTFLFIRLPKGDFKFKDNNKRTGRATPRKRGKVSVESSRFLKHFPGFVCFLSLLSSAMWTF